MRALWADTSGTSILELAFAMPVLMTMGLGLSELASLSIAQSRVNQIAIGLADNASRAKQSVVNNAPRMREFDVNETFTAAQLQFPGMDLLADGRVVLSSLETNSSGGQWIHWQRCFGHGFSGGSAYGPQGTGATGTAFQGMGTATNRVAAESGAAIMFAEVKYRYRPLFFNFFLGDQVITKTAAMYVRDDRDLTQIYNPAPTATVQSC
jgi:hypothetical protein